MTETSKTELNEIYNKISDANKNEATLIYNELVFIIDTIEQLKDDIKKNGATDHFINGKQDFIRESPSLASYNKLMKTYDMFYKNLINLLPKEQPVYEDTDDEIEAFLSD